jgi:hypothetical protein
MYMCPIPNGFRDRAIPLYSYKIFYKKEILRSVSNAGIYCSSDKVGTPYLVQYNFENSPVNINALCISCDSITFCSSEWILTFLYLGNRSEQDTYIYISFCFEWPLLWPPSILSFPAGTRRIFITAQTLHSVTQSQGVCSRVHKRGH